VTSLDRNGIEGRIPHRYENLLLDSCTPEPDNPGNGVFAVTITKDDPIGRSLFTQTLPEGTRLLTSISMEVLALGAIASTAEIPEGYVAYFAAISNFSRNGEALNAASGLSGQINKISDKGGFYRYKGTLKDTQGNETTGDVLAFYTKVSDAADAETEGKKVEVPGQQNPVAVPAPPWKTESMRVVDSLSWHNDDYSEWTCQYTYPASHPLTKGHFPDNPVMMGVMQWMMAEDAVWGLHQSNPVAPGIQTINVNILKLDGTVICEMKKVQVEWTKDNIPQIIATKKVTFRGIVRPEETLVIHCRTVE
jgi:3-hydroxymyristoyl/3-hydroxydecanoyl-(acyl carrier protein) dehydratase